MLFTYKATERLIFLRFSLQLVSVIGADIFVIVE